MHFLLASSVLFCYTTGMGPITIRKRTLAKTDLELVQATVNDHWEKTALKSPKSFAINGTGFRQTVVSRIWLVGKFW